MCDSSVKCVFCGQDTLGKVKFFTPETLNKCLTTLEYRRVKPILRKSSTAYTEVGIHDGTSLNDGYHAHCYKLFTAIKVPADFQRQHVYTPESAQEYSSAPEPAEECDELSGSGISSTAPAVETTTDEQSNNSRNADEQGWNEESIENAIEAVKRKEMGWQMAAKIFNVPYATLKKCALLKKKALAPPKKGITKSRHIFTPEMESELVEHIKMQKKTKVRFTRKEVLKLAYQFANIYNIPHNFSNTKKMAGKKWLSGFQKRHPDVGVTVKKPAAKSTVEVDEVANITIKEEPVEPYCIVDCSYGYDSEEPEKYSTATADVFIPTAGLSEDEERSTMSQIVDRESAVDNVSEDKWSMAQPGETVDAMSITPVSCEPVFSDQVNIPVCELSSEPTGGYLNDKVMPRSRPSIIWKYFKQIDAAKAKCNSCGEIYSFRTSIANLKTHLKRKHLDAYMHVLLARKRKGSNLGKESRIPGKEGIIEEDTKESVDYEEDPEDGLPEEAFDDCSSDSGTKLEKSKPSFLKAQKRKIMTKNQVQKGSTSDDLYYSALSAIADHYKKPKLSQDRSDCYGRIVALKLKGISDNSQRLIAEKLISDTLYMAELGTLTAHHSVNNVLVGESSFQPSTTQNNS